MHDTVRDMPATDAHLDSVSSAQSGETRSLNIAYLCLQVTKEGQASHAHVHEIISGLRELGHTVTLYEPRHLRHYGPLVRAWEFYKTQSRLRREAADADVIYCRAHFATRMTSKWARRQGIPMVLEVNGPYEDLFIAWPKTRFLRQFFEWLMGTEYRNADALLTVTGGLQSWLAHETGRDDVRVVPNGANHRLFHPGVPRIEGLPDRYVAFVGSLARWQGIPYMLAAMSEPQWPADVMLLIAGDGAERDMVEEAARVNERVVYLGKRPYADIPAILCSSIASLVTMTDLCDRASTGLSPLKLYEAMACAVPAITTDFPGQAELLRDERCGILIPSEDPKAIADAVEALAADPEEAHAMGARGRIAIEREHSWARRAEQTAAILDSAAR
ncbi:MAG: glycosyltransferase family 4 protein [Coriobacteriia bacterium]|jgi:glycosyltransferase involved in cell wall biosynthesis|nr:glycosyltransferase family 4 protein [Coriobacteriia bacterium]